MKIGVFDSGVGGLWILKHLRETYPSMDYVFVADQAHVPYGTKSIEEVRNFSENITKFLISKGCSLIVIACNTASGASLHFLREKFPDIIFVGMEPALKPATEVTHTHKVGVLATKTTFAGDLYNSLKERFGKDTEIYENPCIGLVAQVENHDLNGEETRGILRNAVTPMLANGIDTLVLGCTHYPFILPIIKEMAGENINIIDPTPAIVRRVGELVSNKNGSGELEVFTTGESLDNIKAFLEKDTKIDKIQI